MDAPIGTKLGLGFGFLTALLVATALAAWVWIERIAADSIELVEVERLQQEAILEMEINTLEAALAAIDHLLFRRPEDKDEIRDAIEDFEAFAQRFQDLAKNAVQRELGHRVRAVYEEIAALGSEVMTLADDQQAALVELRNHEVTIGDLIEYHLQTQLDRSAPNSILKLEAVLEMEISVNEAVDAIKVYLVLPQPEVRRQLDGAIGDFHRYESAYRAVRLAPDESASLDRIAEEFAIASAAGRDLMAQADTMRQKLDELENRILEVDTLLDEQVQPAVVENLQTVSERTKRSVGEARWFLLISSLLAIASGVATSITMARGIATPIRRLARAAAEIGQGRFGTTVEVATHDEVGTLAKTINSISMDLRKTTVAREYLDGILRSMAESVVVVGRDGIIESSNRATRDLTGYPYDELIGHSLDMIVQDPRLRAANIAKWVDEGAVEQFECAYRTRDGKAVAVLVVAAPMVDASGVADRIVLCARDYREQQQARRDLSAYADRLARSNADLERFAYIASHDLQEPLRMVSSFTQLLVDRYADKLDDQAREYVAFAVDGSKRMSGLIRDLLEFSRVSKQDKRLAPTDCGELVDEACLNLRSAIEEIGAKVIRGELPTVIGDSRRLGQLFQNLIGNAIKYRGKAPPEVHVSAVQGHGEWRFAVRDNGIGIEPQYFERIFQVFRRLHGVSEYPGTGIGLAICKAIVERHGGRIWVDSQLGSGSTFYFTIPVQEDGLHDGNQTKLDDRRPSGGGLALRPTSDERGAGERKAS